MKRYRYFIWFFVLLQIGMSIPQFANAETDLLGLANLAEGSTPSYAENTVVGMDEATKAKFLQNNGNAGKLSFPINLSGEFEINFRLEMSFAWGGEGIDFSLIASDDSYITASFKSAWIDFGEYSDYLPDGWKNTTSGASNAINDVRLNVSNGIAKLYLNDIFFSKMTLSSPNLQYTKLNLSGFEGKEKVHILTTDGGTTTATPNTGTTTNKLTGISTRAYVGNTAENYMYAGVTTSGDAGATKKVAVQAVGKGLIAAGLNTALDAQLEIKSFPDQILVDKNNAWQNHARAAELLALGQNPADVTDSATLTDLTMGNFTANVMPKGNPGVGIVSVYDMDTASSSRLTGISTRAYVGNTPENYMYAGITVEGNVRVVIQAVGQGLVPLGVNTTLDAKVEVYTFPDRRLVASNDNWQDGVDAVTLQQNGHAPASPFDAAMYVNLTTGSYTIDVKPSGYGNPGVGLVSAYEVQ